MKRKDKENLKFITDTLAPLNEKIETPDALSPNSIVALVADKKQNKKRRAKRVLRSLSAVAAALIIAVGLGFYLDYATKTEMPKIYADAEYPVSGNTEEDIVEYFKAAYDHLYRKYSVDYFFGTAEDGMVVEEDTMLKAESAVGTITESYNNAATGTVQSDNADFGTTNTQIATIDEEDIVKNDGRYLYILSRYYLKIVDAKNMKLVSTTPVNFNEGNIEFNGIYIYQNRLAVIASTFRSTGEKTYLNLYDISDRSDPKLIEEFNQQGIFFTSRLVGSKIILLSKYYFNCDCKKSEITFENVAPHVEQGGEVKVINAPMITVMPQDKSYSEANIVMTTVDLEEKNPEFKSSAVLGSGSDVYCTNKNLYIISYRNRYEEIDGRAKDFRSVTQINRFSIENGVIEAKASGEVLGSTLNQFSLDEKGGYLRVATTDSFTAAEPQNIITVLDMNLKEVAKIDGIAPGETIQSVRYIGNYGYVVTFEQTDPLFVIDFKDMKNPKIVGELKIPGFSSYLHPFNGYLVGIGIDGDENGTVNALKISLFDISDPEKPQEVDRFILKNAWANSFHKTVMDCSHKNILGFIYTDYSTDRQNFCTLEIKEGKIKIIGSYNNADSNDEERGMSYNASGSEKLMYYTSGADEANILRGTYIGNTLYTISNSRICSYPLFGGECIAKLDY